MFGFIKLLVIGCVATFSAALPAAHTVFNSSAAADVSGKGDSDGINCRGSLFCHKLFAPTYNIWDMTHAIHEIPDERQFRNGEQIACGLWAYDPFTELGNEKRRALCAYFEDTNDQVLTGALAKKLIEELRDHDCRYCGSVPTQKGNNVKLGRLTVNFVHKGCEVEGGTVGPCIRPLPDVPLDKIDHTTMESTESTESES